MTWISQHQLSITFARMSPEDYRDTFWAMLRDAIDQVRNWQILKRPDGDLYSKINLYCICNKSPDADPPSWFLQTNILWADVQCCVQVSDSYSKIVLSNYVILCQSLLYHFNLPGVFASSTVKFCTGTCSTTWGYWVLKIWPICFNLSIF